VFLPPPRRPPGKTTFSALCTLGYTYVFRKASYTNSWKCPYQPYGK